MEDFYFIYYVSLINQQLFCNIKQILTNSYKLIIILFFFRLVINLQANNQETTGHIGTTFHQLFTVEKGKRL